jgi:hypothetical protein
VGIMGAASDLKGMVTWSPPSYGDSIINERAPQCKADHYHLPNPTDPELFDYRTRCWRCSVEPQGCEVRREDGCLRVMATFRRSPSAPLLVRFGGDIHEDYTAQSYWQARPPCPPF